MKPRAPSGVLALVTILALAMTGSTVAPAAADEYCQRTSHPVASVLVIHGGGWSGGSAAYGRDICRPLAKMGYRVRLLEYPLHTVPGSIRYARDAAVEEARRGRPVYAMGVSAGGSVAESLAVKPYIDGAVAVAPLSDFVDWRPPTPGFWGALGMTPAMRRLFSPYHNVDAPAPMRIIHSPQDQVVPYEQSVRMVERCGQACELVTLKLGLGHASLGAQGPALEWFARRVSNPSFATSAPALSQVSLRPRAFAVARPSAAGVRSSRRRSPKRGSTFGYRLSKRASVTFTIRRRPPARRRGRCLGNGSPDARFAWGRRIGRFTVQGAAGENRTSFAGIVGSRALGPGCYGMTAVATNPSGRRSHAWVLHFRVVR